MSRAPNPSSPNVEVLPSPVSWGGPAVNEAAGEPMLGSYRLLGVLAEGEHSRIYRARSCVLPAADVAIKRLRAPNPRAARARLLREARIGLGLHDRHLVRVLALHDDPELYVVTQLVEGASLEQLLRAQLGVDALRFIVPMLVDVLHGLSALHQWRNEEGAPTYLVHQAVRARHILAGGDGVTRLIDLGDVHGSPFSGTTPLLPRQDGVDPYAPEQFDASQGLDPRCDVFLAGVVLRDVLTRLGIGRSASWAPLHAVAERASAAKRSARFWSAEEMAYTLQNAAIEAGVYASRAAIGAWVQALRAGVSVDSSRGSGLRLRVGAALAAESAERSAPVDDDEELGFDVKTTAWERPLERSSLPPDLQELLHDESEPAPASALPAAPRVAARRTPPRLSETGTPTLVIREAAAPGPLQRWTGVLALAGVGLGLAALGLRGPVHIPASPARADVAPQVTAAALPSVAPPSTPVPIPSVTPAPSPLPAASRRAEPARSRSSRAPVVVERESEPQRDGASAESGEVSAPAPLPSAPEELPQNPY